MLYGHVETYEERIDHLLRLRDLQDETGGFLAFIPLAFHRRTPSSSGAAGHTPPGPGRPQGDRGVQAHARQRRAREGLLDHDGQPLAAVALHFGANDVQGTVMRETIFHEAGARTETEQKIEELVRFVRDAGRAGAARHALQRGPPVGVSLGAIPALPARDVAASVAFYNVRLGFETLHHDSGFAVLRRDDGRPPVGVE